MKETIIKRWIWAICIAAFALAVAMVLIWKFRFYDAVTLELTQAQDAYEKAKTEAENLEANQKAALLEEQKTRLAEQQLAYFRARFRAMPYDLRTEGARNATWIRHLNEYYLDFGVAAREQLLRAADETGVIIETGIKVAPPPQMPENVAAPPSGFLKPTADAGAAGGAPGAVPTDAAAGAAAPGGALSVKATGSYPDILRFLDRVNRSPIIMTVGNLKLEGTSPSIEATFALTPYMISSGPSAQVAAPPAPAAAAPAEGGIDPATGEPIAQ